jgi:uncharacterized protein
MSTAKTDILFTLGEAEQGTRDWPDYLQYGFEASDESALIKLIGDKSLHGAAGDSLEVWVPLHAWRTLGQLRSERAIMPLIELFEALIEDDWALHELPTVMGMIGNAAIEPLGHYIMQQDHKEFARATAMAGLSEIAKQHPTQRNKVIEHYRLYLQQADNSTPIINGLLISYLLDIDGKELIDDVRDLFTRQCVDITCAGDIEDVEMALGLRLERSTPKVMPSQDYDPSTFDPNTLNLNGLDTTPLPRPDGDDLIEWLDYYLDHHGNETSVFDVSELDGFFAAIACAPQMVMPSMWLPAIWGEEEQSPAWDSLEEANAFSQYAISFYNIVMSDMNDDNYEALYMQRVVNERTYTLVDDWCAGFLRGISLWGPISPADTVVLEVALAPIRQFSTERGLGELAELNDDEVEQCQQAIEPAVRKLFLHFLERRTQDGQTAIRTTQKSGRNDPCPCGSGKKYKKCCLH